MALYKGEVNVLTAKLIDEVFSGNEIVMEEGNERSLFASAITPKGFCNYLDSILINNKVYEIKGGIGTGEEKILQRIKYAAVVRGYDVETYFCALNPYKLEHLVIPALNVAFTTSNWYHSSNITKFKSIDIHEFLNQSILSKYKEDLFQNLTEFDNLLSIAFLTISRAKELHDQLETYYIPNINFEEVDKCFNETIAWILK